MDTRFTHYRVGISFLEEEHSELFDLMNNCKKALQNSEDPHDYLMGLYLKLKEHFQHEEDFLTDNNFPELDHHKSVHVNLLWKLNQVLNHPSKSFSYTMSSALLDTLESVIVTHIDDYDMQYRRHFENIPKEDLIFRTY